jgi:hypothetical protein
MSRTNPKTSKKAKTPNLSDHDTEIWFRAATKMVAQNLKSDNDREMLELFVSYLAEASPKERAYLADKLSEELYLACEVKSESREAFKVKSAVSANEFFGTIKFLRGRVGPSDNELGRKLHGGAL